MVVSLPRYGPLRRVTDLVLFNKNVRGASDEKSTIRIRIVPTKDNVAINVGRRIVHNCKDVAIELHRIAKGAPAKCGALVFCTQSFHHSIPQELIHQVRVDERIWPVVWICTALPPGSKSATSLHCHPDDHVVDTQAIELKRTNILVVRLVEYVLTSVQHLASIQCCS